MKIGIFGGSFNPIHNGHFSLALQLKEQAGLDEVWLMVSPHNPLKQPGDLLDDELRLEMARLAVKDMEGIVASDYEIVVYTRTPGDPGFIDISSTDIRRRIREGRGIRRLVPKAVADYIKEHRLYV